MRGEREREGFWRVRTESAEETEELGVILGRLLAPGDLLFLSGDLGSGKTLFVRGITAGLGSDEPATSPTFSLVHRYDGDLPLYHLDLYRLTHPGELEALALEEMLSEEAAMVVEWGDLAKGVLPPAYLEVLFERGADEGRRELTFKPHGERYSELVKELMAHAGLGD